MVSSNVGPGRKVRSVTTGSAWRTLSLRVLCSVARRRAPPGGVSPPGSRCLVLPHEVRSRQPTWAASATRRGPSARRNGCKNCRALCCRVLRSGLQSRVKRSAQGKKGTRPRVIAQSALHIYMGTPLRARPRHRVIVRVAHTIPACPGAVATEALAGRNSKNYDAGHSLGAKRNPSSRHRA